MDLYDVLEIPENANDIWIRRAYDLKLKQLAKRTDLSDEQLEKRRIAIEKAFNVLSNADSRERYDRRDEAPVSPSPVATLSKLPMRRQFWIAGGIAVAIAAIVAWGHQNDLRQQREAAAQAAAELNAAAAVRLASEAAAEKRRTTNITINVTQTDPAELQAHREAVHRQRELIQLQRESATAQAAANNEIRRAAELDRARREEARRAQYEEETSRRRAQAELDRQAAWLQQQEQRRRR